MAYYNPIYTTYTLPAATLSSAATLYTFAGPSGKTGVLVDISASVTTETTTAATAVSVGTSSDTDAYGVLSVPAAAAGNTYNGATISTGDDNLITADSEVVIATDGGCDAGAADLAVTLAWF